MNALLEFVADAPIEAIASLPLDSATALRTVRAFNKLLWIQNDFIDRRYRHDGYPT